MESLMACGRRLTIRQGKEHNAAWAAICVSKKSFRISQFDGANERCKVSNQPNRLSALFLSMQPFTTRSTCTGIESVGGPLDNFGLRRIILGAMRHLRPHTLRPRQSGFLSPAR